MRIALIAGSTEPGKDGIGDHACILAAEMNRRGHTAWVLAIGDGHIKEPLGGKSDVEGTEVTTLRLPAKMSNARRYSLALAALDNAETEAVLYDFSPTQYQGRGLIWPVANDMASLAFGRKRALLAHEYCLGREHNAGLKRRLWGQAQLLGFRRFTRNLNGLRIAATNPLYAKLLEQDGYAAQIVPLFGNVPVLPPPQTNWCHARLREAGVTGSGAREFYCAGFFGSLYEGTDLAAALPMLQEAAQATGGRLAVLSVGYLGNSAAIWQDWQSRFGPGTAADIAFVALGRREASDVSAYIQSLDLGLSSVPMVLAGKSGTLAAFADHGLTALMLNDSESFDALPDKVAALPAIALPPTAQTAALLARQPIPPRLPSQKARLAATADWLERVLA